MNTNATQSHKGVQLSTEDLFRRLDEAPPWRDEVHSTPEAKRQLIAACRDISSASTEQIRSMVVMVHEKSLEMMGQIDNRWEEPYDSAYWGKLFVLNRYLFDVPEFVPVSEARAFGGWIGVPYDDTHVGILWPLKFVDNNDLQLDGSFGGYNGTVYDGPAEFDYFLRKFGRRHSGPNSP